MSGNNSNPRSLLNTAFYRELLRKIDDATRGSKALTVLNATGSTLDAGTVVYVEGTSGSIPSVDKARANSPATMPSVGILTKDISSGQQGFAQFAGIVENVDTSAFTDGDTLYVSAATAGAVTATQPAHPNLSQAVAIVLVASATGTLFVLPGIDLHGIDLGTNQNTFNIGDGSAGTKTLAFVNSSIGQLQWAPSSARTLTLPDATDTLVGKNTIDTLTNKIYQGTSIAVTGGGGFNGASPQSPYSLGASSTIPEVAALQSALRAWGIGS